MNRGNGLFRSTKVRPYAKGQMRLTSLGPFMFYKLSLPLR